MQSRERRDRERASKEEGWGISSRLEKAKQDLKRRQITQLLHKSTKEQVLQRTTDCSALILSKLMESQQLSVPFISSPVRSKSGPDEAINHVTESNWAHTAYSIGAKTGERRERQVLFLPLSSLPFSFFAFPTQLSWQHEQTISSSFFSLPLFHFNVDFKRLFELDVLKIPNTGEVTFTDTLMISFINCQIIDTGDPYVTYCTYHAQLISIIGAVVLKTYEFCILDCLVPIFHQ